MKQLLVACLALFAGAVLAEDITWSGDYTSACTFSGTTPGTLSVDGSTFGTVAIASYDVTNNEAGVYTVIFPAITAFTSAPGTATMTNPAVQGITPTGANTNAPTGDDASGFQMALANIGQTSFNHTISGSITDGVAGTYSVTSPVTCVAL